MATPKEIKILSQHPLFKGIKAVPLKKLLQKAKRLSYKPGAIIFEEGAPSNYFYIILEGQVHLLTTRQDPLFSQVTEQVIVQTLGKNDLLGWSWVVPPYRWCFNVVATEKTKVLRLDGKWLREQCDKDRTMGYEILQRVATSVVARLMAMRMHFGGRVFQQAEGA